MNAGGAGWFRIFTPLPGPSVTFDPIQARDPRRRRRADHPDLARRQGIAADAVLAVQLGRDHELLHPVLAHRVAELRVAKLGGPDPLLLFLDPAAALQRQSATPTPGPRREPVSLGSGTSA